MKFHDVSVPDNKLFEYIGTSDYEPFSTDLKDNIRDIIMATEGISKDELESISNIVRVFVTSQWMVENGMESCVGSYTTRLKKTVAMMGRGSPYSIKRSTITGGNFTKMVEKIGNLIKGKMPANKPYFFDFTMDFDWERGAFGDSGSCFWTNSASSRAALQRMESSRAVRFYNQISLVGKDPEYKKLFSYYNPDKEVGYEGIARAWLSKWEDGRYYMFNAYGYHLEAMAKILEFALNCKATMTNTYPRCPVYLNNGRVMRLDTIGPQAQENPTLVKVQEEPTIFKTPMDRAGLVPLEASWRRDPINNYEVIN